MFFRCCKLMHVSIHSRWVAWKVCIHYCSLVSATLLQVGRWGGCSSHKFYTCLLEWVASAHYCLFLQVVSHYLGCLLFLDSRSCPIRTWTWGIRSVLEAPPNFWCLRRFRRGFRSGQQIFSHCPFRVSCWLFPSVWSSRKSLLFSLSCWYPPLSSGGFLQALACLKKVPCFLGAPKFLEGLICSCEWSPGKYSPCINVLLFCDEEGLLGYFPCSLMG